METNTATQDSGTAAPAPIATGEDMTPAELAFFQSRGEKTDGLFETPAAVTTQDKPAEASNLAQDGQKSDPEEIEGTVEIDANGRAHDRLTGKFVPLGALQKERAERKAVTTERDTLKEQFTKVSERLAILNEALNGNAPAATAIKAEPEQPIDPEKDIFGAFRQTAAELAALKKQMADATSKTEQRFAQTDMQTWVHNDLVAFQAKQPAFKEAFTHAVNQRVSDLAALGIGKDDTQRKQMVINEVHNLASEARKDGKSFSERVWNFATARGFKAAAASTAPTSQNGTQRPAANADTASKIEQLAKGQAAAQTLSTVGGSPTGGLTVDSLLNMSEADFDAAVSKLSRADYRRILGG